MDIALINEVARAEANVDVGASLRMLELAAQYMREGKPVPQPLADWLANAIDAAVSQGKVKDAGGTLLLKLGLRAKNRRKSVVPWEVEALYRALGARDDAMAAIGLPGKRMTKSKRKQLCCEEFDIDLRTLNRLLKEAAAIRESREIRDKSP